MSKDALQVFMNGLRVGTWWVERKLHCFSYDPQWVTDPKARPISLSLPLAPTLTYKGDVVESFFDNLLPDSKDMRRRLQAQFGLSKSDTLSLLSEIGRDCIGALQLLPNGMLAPDPRVTDGVLLSDQEIADLLNSLSSFGVGSRGSRVEPFRISLAGVQEKTALLYWKKQWMRPLGSTPTTHILKLPIGSSPNSLDLTNSVENEWLCHLIVKAFGLPIAASEIRLFEEAKCLVVERFDRRMHPDGWLLRLPQEDFCQATGISSALKYQNHGGPGIRACTDLLLGAERPLEDRRTFLAAQFVYYLLCAIDGHGKNFSLLLKSQGAYSLAPLYDVMSAYPLLGKGRGKMAPQDAEMAMAVWGKSKHYRWKAIARRHWLKTLSDCGISNAESFIEEILKQVPSVCEQVALQLPKTFPRSVSEPILTGLQNAATKMSR